MNAPRHQSCSIVLVRTKFAGNLGSVARAMANFAVSDLRLVTPEASIDAGEARALSTHGEHLLDQARVFPSLREAVSDCVWVCATTARSGGLYRKQNTLDLKEAVQRGKAQSTHGPIAFVFGPEDHGLTNDEISLCHHLLHIHANPEYNVLNLAQAAVICLYEWYQATSTAVAAPKEPPVPLGELARSLDHLEEALRAVHFIWGEKGDSVAHAIRHLISRSAPDALENKLLHGLARQLLWYVEHHPPTKKPPDEREASQDLT